MKNQITSISNCIEKIETKELELGALISSSKKDFCDFRNIELESQISNIGTQIENIVTEKNEFLELLSTTRNDYCDIRHKELEQQNEILSEIIDQIDPIITENKNNLDLTNELKINSFTFKILAVFSKQKKQTIADQLKLQLNFIKLQEQIEIAKDFSSSDFGTNLNSKLNYLNVFKNDIINAKPRNVRSEKHSVFFTINIHTDLHNKSNLLSET